MISLSVIEKTSFREDENKLVTSIFFFLFRNALKTSIQDPYSPTFLENVLCLILHTFLYLATFECNATSDWLNGMV